MTADPAQTELAGQLAGDARIQLGRLRVAWGWLGDARQPGTPGPPATRPVDLRGAARAATEHRLDKAAAVEAVRAGRKIGGERPVPLRLGPSMTRTRIGADLADLAARMWWAVHTTRQPHHPDPAGRVLFRACGWCAGTGRLTAPTGWPGPWPTDPLDCPRCEGRRKLPTGIRCPACAATGPCRCDPTEHAAHHSITIVGQLLDVCGVEPAADADATLYDLADQAEAAAGAGRDRRRLTTGQPGQRATPPECPVCAGREMYAEVSSPDRREWAIYCTGPVCLCHGPGCLCGIGTERRRDRRHMWPARTWNTLADLLGADPTPLHQPEGPPMTPTTPEAAA